MMLSRPSGGSICTACVRRCQPHGLAMTNSIGRTIDVGTRDLARQFSGQVKLVGSQLASSLVGIVGHGSLTHLRRVGRRVGRARRHLRLFSRVHRVWTSLRYRRATRVRLGRVSGLRLGTPVLGCDAVSHVMAQRICLGGGGQVMICARGGLQLRDSESTRGRGRDQL